MLELIFIKLFIINLKVLYMIKIDHCEKRKRWQNSHLSVYRLSYLILSNPHPLPPLPLKELVAFSKNTDFKRLVSLYRSLQFTDLKEWVHARKHVLVVDIKWVLFVGIEPVLSVERNPVLFVYIELVLLT